MTVLCGLCDGSGRKEFTISNSGFGTWEGRSAHIESEPNSAPERDPEARPVESDLDEENLVGRSYCL